MPSDSPCQLPSYHMHTNYSDASASVRDMVKAAEDHGVTEIAISDHFAILPDGTTDLWWSITPERLPEYVADVQAANAETDITVRLGIEIDYFPETCEQILAILEPYPFDVIIGSVHYDAQFPIDADIKHWDGLDQDTINEIFRNYWGWIARLAGCGLFDFIGHLDLVKKFGHTASVDLSEAIGAALDAIQQADIPIELNTAGWHKPCAECYPAEDLLTECFRRGIRVLISDDAHTPEHVGRDFDRALTLLKRIGYTESVRFCQRRPEVYSLP